MYAQIKNSTSFSSNTFKINFYMDRNCLPCCFLTYGLILVHLTSTLSFLPHASPLHTSDVIGNNIDSPKDDF